MAFSTPYPPPPSPCTIITIHHGTKAVLLTELSLALFFPTPPSSLLPALDSVVKSYSKHKGVCCLHFFPHVNPAGCLPSEGFGGAASCSVNCFIQQHI